MTSHIRTVLRQAMTQLKNGNVLEATAVIQRSLGIGSAAKDLPPSSSKIIDLQALARHPFGKATPVASDRIALDESAPVTRPMSNALRKSAPGSDKPGKAAGFTSRTYHSNAGSVSYKLYIPADIRDEHPALVMMLHGCTQNADDFARGTGMNKLADEFGFIVAYPLQPRTANPQGCWNWFDDRHQRRGSGEPVLLAGLAQELAREFKIDDRRVFAAGLSAGGAMADVLAATYPDVFAAIGIHSGLPAGAATNMMSALAAMKGSRASAPRSKNTNNRFVRKIIVHGDADATVNASNGDAILNQSRKQQPNAVEISNDTTVNGRRITRTVLQEPDGHSLVEHWAVHGSGHAWAGGHQGGSYVDPTGPDASREMVRFFLQR